MCRSVYRLRLVAIVVAWTSLAIAAVACDHSPTRLSGPTAPPNPHAREVDTFAFNAIGGSRWTIGIGVIAAYFLQSAGSMHARDLALGRHAPPPIGPRLLLDTIVVSDTLSGPPAGTDLVTPTYLAFDGGGNLWMSVLGAHGSGSVIEYSRAQINQDGSLSPTITLTGTKTPMGLAFDGSGNLWVVDSGATVLDEFTGLELRTGGSPASSIALSGIQVGGATWAPLDVAIDPAGNLWVSAQPRTLPAGPAGDSVPAYVIAKFTDSALKASSTPSPALTLAQPGGHSRGYGPGMAFDGAGDLWTVNASSSTATKFTAQSLAASGNPVPAVTLSASAFSGASDIAIDAAGVMYVGGSVVGTGAGFFAFSPPAVAASGSPTPKLVFTSPVGANHFAIK